MIAAAGDKLAAGQSGDEPGADWLQGVIAALLWIAAGQPLGLR